MRQIRIDLHKLPVQAISGGLTRQAYLQQRKQHIVQLRNQYLSSALNFSICDHDLARAEHGKPYLKDHSNIAFNHSHSQNFYALAMSQTVKEIGVDVEELSRKVRFQALAEHAFHPEELKMWQSLDCDPEYWFKVWTTKEAVLKANGLGIRINLNELNTQVHPDQDGGMCSLDQLGAYAYQNYQVGNCILSVAWQAEQSCRGFTFPRIQIYQHPPL
ncbi:4'-phosphopantetheinyl transferase family protein [Acinetobacter schindleri]|uniref:4'-phosphopantetheinyl transferase superfamily protein n=1 Tax=Acinetobacter schindleri TaxID=108981 RepID=A0AAE6WXT9_9GAMM|nr:4'-phosphopantetheinyl transferase superfamily protein [Acinetobacter schindleri]QIC68131.1 4'-phosphopantetheinyl transferase superfamily protein [Acinetobacter schindleri]